VLKFIVLILKNLGRNKLRTGLTALAVTVMVTICVEMRTIVGSVARRVEADGSQSRLMVTERWVVPSRIPVRYLPALAHLDGVEDWTTWSTYPGFFNESRQAGQEVFGVATRPDNLIAMHAGLAKLDPNAVEVLKRTKDGVLLAADVAQELGCRPGQPFTLFSAADPTKSLRLKVVGVMPVGEYPRMVFFRRDFFEDATGEKDVVDIMWLRARDAEAARHVAAQVQEQFGNRQPELKVETESAGVARFADRSRSILSVIRLVITILLIDMIVVLSNSISVATRERRVEMAVLKVLGFEPRAIMALVIGEAVLVGAASGLLGTGLTWGCSALALSGLLPPSGFTQLFYLFPIGAEALLWGGLLGALVGFAGSVVPAWNARGVKVSDVFAKIA
jgi:putative ABC transport system permease protein